MLRKKASLVALLLLIGKTCVLEAATIYEKGSYTGVRTSNPNYTLDINATNGSGLNISGANSRLYFHSKRALEGSKSDNLLVGEQYKNVIVKNNLSTGGVKPEAALHVANGNLQVGLEKEAYHTVLSPNGLIFNRDGFSYIDNKKKNGSIVFRTGGRNRNDMIIKSNGYVGVGTNDPKYKLHIQGPSKKGETTLFLLEKQSGWGTTSFTQFYNSYWNYGLKLHDGSERWHLILPKGKMGIGVVKPKARLQVNTKENRALKLVQENKSMSNGVYTFEIDNRKHQSNVSAAGPMKVDVHSGTAFAIDGSGKVGMGTNSPKSQLHIKYNTNKSQGLRSEVVFGNQKYPNVRYTAIKAVNLHPQAKSVAIGYEFASSDKKPLLAASVDALLVKQEAGYIESELAFSLRDKTGYYERMRLTKSGLTVPGTIKAEEIIVTPNVWADYVFNSDYNLLPLNELESYIKANKHLPNIPSEDEVKNNGVNMTEMQVKLLQKIEELTLYIIEQDKRIKKLETQLKK